MDQDLVIVLRNRYVLGMTEFSLASIFNIVGFFTLIITGLVRQSTGFYLLLLFVADTIYLLCTVLMEEFYTDWIDVDVFDESGEAIVLCQVVYFCRELFYYWRWLLMAILVIDRCLYVGGTVSMPRLRIGAVIFSLSSLAVAAGLAGYWIYWVDNDLITGDYVEKTCKFTLAPADDKSSEWFYMEAIVHILLPDGILSFTVLVSSVALLCLLNGKSAQSLEPEHFNFTKAVIALAFTNLLILIPYLVVNCILLYIDRKWDVYDFSATVQENLQYTAAITGKFRDFNSCIAFFILIFARQFRSAFCSN